MKPGFEHHGQLTSETAFKMLCMRGGRAAARTHKANDWEHQKRIAQISRANRMRRTLSKMLTNREAEWPVFYGETLLAHLLFREHA